MSGWVCLHRKFLSWEWYDDINTKALFIHCLLRANHAPKKWRGIDVPAGSFITGRKVLSEEIGITVQQIRTCLDRLKSTNEITIESTSSHSVVTVVNWASYQNNDINQPANQPANQQTDNQQSTSNQPLTTSKQLNNKEKKGRSHVFVPPTIKEVEEYLSEKGIRSFTAESFVDHYEANGWIRGKTKIKDWKACARTWKSRNKGEDQKTNSMGWSGAII